MENKVVEAVRESVEAMRSSLLKELRQLCARVDQMEEKVDCVMLATAAASLGCSMLRMDSTDDSDVGQMIKSSLLYHELFAWYRLSLS